MAAGTMRPSQIPVLHSLTGHRRFMSSNRKTLLAKLAPMFGAQTENLAVEALAHILSESEAARRALYDLLQAGGVHVDSIARVRTQVAAGNTRPDLVGFDRHNEECLLIEAKFWAGLTEAQPVDYLTRLTKNSSATPHEPKTTALLFVAPAARLESLWAELWRQASNSRIALQLIPDTPDGYRSALAGGGRCLLLTSWRSLLDHMAAKAAAASDSRTETDIGQLQGLAEQEDDEAFLPLRQEDLAPAFPRRMRSLRRLVDDATEKAVEGRLLDVTGLKVAPRHWGYGRYVRIAGEVVWFGVHFKRWAHTRTTPLWLIFQTGRSALEPLRQADPQELFNDQYVPIYLPVEKEYDAVVDAVVKRLAAVVRDLGNSAA